MNQHHNPANIRRGITVLGIAALLVGGLTASLLYWSFGVSILERTAYAFIGVIFAAAGGLLLPASVALWQSERPGAAAGVLLFWFAAILPLGLSGHAGFFSVAQSELAAQSIPAQAERARLDAIETQLQAAGGAAGADVAGLQSQAETLREQLRAARDALMACDPTYRTKCVNPAQQRVDAIQVQLSPIESQLRGHSQYAALQSQRAETVAALAAATSGAVGAGGYHPLFGTLSKLLGIDAGRIQAVFMAWSAVALELVAALSFIIAGALNPAQSAPAAPVQPTHLPPAGVVRPDEMDGAIIPPGDVPALDTGAFVTGDGYAYLHAGERVLNAAETAEYQRWRAQQQGGLNKAGLNTGGPNKAGLTGGPTVQHHWHGLERVPPELSRRAGAGRVGKLDTCRDCGEDYQVKMHNATRCPPCTEKAQATYKRWRK